MLLVIVSFMCHYTIITLWSILNSTMDAQKPSVIITQSLLSMSELTNNLNTRDPLRLTVTILSIINATPTKENGFQDGQVRLPLL